MKRAKLLLAGALTVCTMLINAPAKAAGTSQTTTQSASLWDGLTNWWNGLFGGGGSGSGSTSGSTGATSGGGTSLPINGGVWLLVAAGAIVGCKVIMEKSKEIAVQKA